MGRQLFSLVTGWVLYSVIIAVVAAVQNGILLAQRQGVSGLELWQAMDLGVVLVRFLLFTATGFVVYGFVRFGLGYLPWLNHPTKGAVIRVGVLYLLVTLSTFLTFALTYKALPFGVVVDFPIIHAIAMLIFASLPYTRKQFFSPQSL